MGDAGHLQVPRISLRTTSVMSTPRKDSSEVRENLNNIRMMAERNIERTRSLYGPRQGVPELRPLYPRDGSNILNTNSHSASRFRQRPLFTFSGGDSAERRGTPTSQSSNLYTHSGRQSPSLILSNHLLSCQRELEKVQREKHDLERKCMEMETDSLALYETIEDLTLRLGNTPNNNAAYQSKHHHLSPEHLSPRVPAECDVTSPNAQTGSFFNDLHHSVSQAVAVVQSSQQANVRMRQIIKEREDKTSDASPKSPRADITTVYDGITAVELINFFMILQNDITRIVHVTDEVFQECDQLRKEEYENGEKLSVLIQKYECNNKATENRIYELECELHNSQDQAAAALRDMEETLMDTEKKLQIKESENAAHEVLSKYEDEMFVVREEHKLIVNYLNCELDHLNKENDDLKLVSKNLRLEIDNLRNKSGTESHEHMFKKEEIEALSEDMERITEERNSLQKQLDKALEALNVFETAEKDTTPAAGSEGVILSDFTEASDRMDKLMQVISLNEEEAYKKHLAFKNRQEHSERSLISDEPTSLLETATEKIKVSVKEFESRSGELQHDLMIAYEKWAESLMGRAQDIGIFESKDTAAAEALASATNAVLELQITNKRVIELEAALMEANEQLDQAKKDMSDPIIVSHHYDINTTVSDECQGLKKACNGDSHDSDTDRVLQEKLMSLEELYDTALRDLHAANNTIDSQSQELSDMHNVRSSGLHRMDAALMRLTTDYGELMDSYVTVVTLLKDIGLELDPFNNRKKDYDEYDASGTENKLSSHMKTVIVPNPSARSILINCHIGSDLDRTDANGTNADISSPTSVHSVVVQLMPSYYTLRQGATVSSIDKENFTVVFPLPFQQSKSYDDGMGDNESELVTNTSLGLVPLSKWPGESYVPVLPSFFPPTSADLTTKAVYEIPDHILFEEWKSFDALTLDDTDHCNGNLLLQVASKLFDNLDIPSSLVDKDTWLRFSETLQRGYRKENPYHNSTHAADVAQGFIFLLRNAVMTKDEAEIWSSSPTSNDIIHPDWEINFLDILTPLERFCCLFAALAHDHQHPGKNNQFLVLHKDPVAIRYYNEAVLESHHVASTFQILQDPSTDVTMLMSEEETVTFHRIVSKMIIATDMAKHIEYLSIFDKKTALVPTSTPEPVSPGIPVSSGGSIASSRSSRRGSRIQFPTVKRNLSSKPLPNSAVENFQIISEDSFRGQTDFIRRCSLSRQVEMETTSFNEQTSENDRIFALQMLLHLSDISNPIRDSDIAVKWTNVINEEFFLQGDHEKHLGSLVSFGCDRDIENTNHVGFIDYIVLPLVRLISRRYPSLHPLLEQLLSNRDVICEKKYPIQLESGGIKSAPPLPLDPDEYNNDKAGDLSLNYLGSELFSRKCSEESKNKKWDRFFEIPNGAQEPLECPGMDVERDTRELEKLIIHTQKEVDTLLKDKEAILGQLEEATNVISTLQERIDSMEKNNISSISKKLYDPYVEEQ